MVSRRQAEPLERPPPRPPAIQELFPSLSQARFEPKNPLTSGATWARFPTVEDTAYSALAGDQARIWRISNTGLVRPFGRNFNKPNGIAFHPTGVMLVAEESPAEPTKGSVLAVGGWRNWFKRGDANGDGTVDISDPIFIWNWVFQGGPVPPCLDGADADDNSKIESADGDRIWNYLFNGGLAPEPPGPNCCGRDPTPDLLDCTKSLGTRCEGGSCAIE